MKVGTSGSLGNAEDLADLRMLESFHIVQDDNRALSFSERFQGARQTTSQFVGFRRVAERRCDRLGERIGIADFLSSRDVERGIGNNAVQPRRERLIGKETIKRTKGMQETFLHSVLCILVREYDRSSHGIRPTLMCVHQRGKCIGVAALRGDHQAVFALAFRLVSDHASRKAPHVRLNAYDNWYWRED